MQTVKMAIRAALAFVIVASALTTLGVAAHADLIWGNGPVTSVTPQRVVWGT